MKSVDDRGRGPERVSNLAMQCNVGYSAPDMDTAPDRHASDVWWWLTIMLYNNTQRWDKQSSIACCSRQGRNRISSSNKGTAPEHFLTCYFCFCAFYAILALHYIFVLILGKNYFYFLIRHFHLCSIFQCRTQSTYRLHGCPGFTQ